MDAGLFILRAVIGTIFMAHGAQKLFGWFGGHGLSGTSGWLDSMGFKPGRLHAGAVGLAEFGGGLLLTLGLFTPFAAAAVIGVMVVAIATVHISKGFFNTEGGFEFNLALIGIALALSFAGPGAWSLDSALNLNLAGWGWGIASLVIGALAATVTLVSKRLASTSVDSEPTDSESSDSESSESRTPHATAA